MLTVCCFLRSEGSKEVFLAIQVDGVTRARTALLTLRGAALPLNHTFHLELERARLLCLLVLTPGELGEPALQTSDVRALQCDETTCFYFSSIQASTGPGTASSWANQEQSVLSGPGFHPPAVQRCNTLPCSLCSSLCVDMDGVFTGWDCVSGSRSQQLCVKLEPRGLLYVKLSLQEKWDTQVVS